MALFGLIGGRKSRRSKERRASERVEPRLVPESRGRSRSAARGKSSQRRRRPILSIFTWGMTLCLWAGIILVSATAYVYVSLDKRGLFQVPEREPGMMLLAADGQVVAERGSFFGDEVRVDELPRYLPEAVIAIEDRRFYSHFGIDPIGLARAFVANRAAGRVVQGGSTLTMQLAKNLFLKPERTYERKFQEAVLAIWLENKYSKEEILQLYLNRVYFGSGADSVGVEKAAQRFFGKSARDVNLWEAAILAGVLKAPSYYNPIANPARAEERAKTVIADMVEEGFITASEAERATSTRTEIKAADYVPATQYIVDWVSEQLPELVGPLSQSIIVETTIDRELQELAETAVRNRLAEQGSKLNISQASLVVLDTQGAVKAMVGGKSYIKSQFNRAVRAKRQPGSSFKPFVYLTALEQGATPDSVEIDEPVTIGDWSPENYKRRYLGPVTLRKALALSLNTVAAKLAASSGPYNVVSTAQRLGIGSPLEPNASIALGTSEVTLLELTSAFAPFANGGSKVIPHVVSRITTRDGQVLYERRGSGLGQVVMAYDVGAMNDMLRTVVTSGTGRSAAIAGHDIAGKTGTSQEYRDAWFIGYSAHLVAGVWAGNDDNTPTRSVTGGSLPAAIWKDVMEPAHGKLPPLPLPGDLVPSDDGFPVAGVRDPGFMQVLQGMFGRSAAVESATDLGGAVPGRAPSAKDQQRNQKRLKDLLDSR